MFDDRALVIGIVARGPLARHIEWNADGGGDSREHGLAHGELAAHLGKPLGTVKTSADGRWQAEGRWVF